MNAHSHLSCLLLSSLSIFLAATARADVDTAAAADVWEIAGSRHRSARRPHDLRSRRVPGPFARLAGQTLGRELLRRDVREYVPEPQSVPRRRPKANAAKRLSTYGSGRRPLLGLVRYEAAYRFETQFRVVIEQNGRKVLDRLYGARSNLKIWPFSQKLKTEVAWDWGASENVVWEGHEAFVDLQPGAATITLVADKQPEPAAKRNVDLVMLTTDADQVRMRIDKESYLPLDGMLTQAGDVFVQVTNASGGKIKVVGHSFPAGTCQQHSPYWVHLRNWKPLEPIELEPGQSTDWVDVGGLLDTLNDGQWGLNVSPAADVKIRCGVKAASGRIEEINLFSGPTGDLPLAFHADTRYSRLLRHREQVLYDLLDYLKRQPAHGKTPAQTLIYGYTFEPGLSPKYDAAVREFKALFALNDTSETAGASGPPRGYIDVAALPPNNLKSTAANWATAHGRSPSSAWATRSACPNPRATTPLTVFATGCAVKVSRRPPSIPRRAATGAESITTPTRT